MKIVSREQVFERTLNITSLISLLICFGSNFSRAKAVIRHIKEDLESSLMDCVCYIQYYIIPGFVIHFTVTHGQAE